jgi:hypothetical protein
VVARDFQCEHIVAELIGRPSERFDQLVFNRIEDRVTVLRRPHEVVLARAYRMAVMSVLITYTGISSIP